MTQTSGPIRISPSGEKIVGENDGDTLVWNATTELWEAEPGGGSSLTATRYVFVNAADPDVGTLNNEGNLLRAATTWTTPAQIPPGELFEVVAWPAGGAACNGLQVDTIETPQITGVTGAGGGCRVSRWFSRTDLIAAQPISMIIPLRSNPAALATTAHTLSQGETGGNCFFGTLVSAFGGAGSKSRDGAVASGGSGGGSRGPGQTPATGGAVRGGMPVRLTTDTGCFGISEGGAGSGPGPADGLFASLGGGGGGAGSAGSSSNPGRPGGCSEQGAGGGGSCGTASDSASGAGGKSGPSQVADTISGGGGLAGTTGSQDGKAGADGKHVNSGDGGGAGFSRGVVANVQGGRGGDGGNPGGGAGSGGNGRGPNGTAWANQGGRGGRGQITVTAYG